MRSFKYFIFSFFLYHIVTAVSISTALAAPLGLVELGSYEFDDGPNSNIVLQYPYVYVAPENQFAILNVSDPSAPKLVGSCAGPEFPEPFAVANNHAYVPADDDGLWVIDVTNPANPRVVNHLPAANRKEAPHGVHAYGNYIFGATAGYDIFVLDISDPANPQTITARDWDGMLTTDRESALAYPYFFVVTRDFSIRAVDVSDPANPVSIGTVRGLGYGRPFFHLADDYLYVACSNSGLYINSIGSPSSPQLVTSYKPESWNGVYNVWSNGTYAIINGFPPQGMETVVLDVTDKSNPILVESLGDLKMGYAVASGNLLYCTGDDKVRIFQSQVALGNDSQPQPDGWSFFDGFSSGSLDRTKWIVSDGAADVSIENGQLKMVHNRAVDGLSWINVFPINSSSLSGIRAKVTIDQSQGNYRARLGQWLGTLGDNRVWVEIGVRPPEGTISAAAYTFPQDDNTQVLETLFSTELVASTTGTAHTLSLYHETGKTVFSVQGSTDWEFIDPSGLVYDSGQRKYLTSRCLDSAASGVVYFDDVYVK